MLTTAPATSPLTGTKRCSACQDRQPLSEFRKEPNCRGGRHTECRSCHNLRERTRAAAKRESSKASAFQDSLRRLDSLKSQRSYLAVVDDLMRLFGGPECLAAKFLEEFETAKCRGDHRTAARVLLAIGSLCQRSDSLRELNPDIGQPVTSVFDGKTKSSEPPNLNQMTDAQLEARQRILEGNA